jgi:hypothetical protein
MYLHRDIFLDIFVRKVLDRCQLPDALLGVCVALLSDQPEGAFGREPDDCDEDWRPNELDTEGYLVGCGDEYEVSGDDQSLNL